MIALKRKPKAPENASKGQLTKGAGYGGIVPPVEYRFKPGQSGNPGGKPRILRDTLTSQLHQTAEDGRKVAAHVVENLIANAQSPWPHSVQAFRTIRELAEPTAAESEGDLGDRGLMKFVASLLMEKKANAIEV